MVTAKDVSDSFTPTRFYPKQSVYFATIPIIHFLMGPFFRPTLDRRFGVERTPIPKDIKRPASHSINGDPAMAVNEQVVSDTDIASEHLKFDRVVTNLKERVVCYINVQVARTGASAVLLYT